MTLKIAKSKVPEGFEVEVAHVAKEKKHWRAHMARVAEDQKNGVTGDKMHLAHPAPRAHPIVEAAINENDAPDYEIVDDANDVLAGKKSALVDQVLVAQHNAIQEIFPEAKKRAWFFREADLAGSDGGIIGKIASAVGLRKMSPDNSAFLSDMADRRKKVEAIGRAGAQTMSDIDDLTAANIDGWKMPDFPK